MTPMGFSCSASEKILLLRGDRGKERRVCLHHTLTTPMKNTHTSKLFKPIAILSLALFAMAQSLSAQAATHDIVLTENSSTDLFVTFDGSPVMVSNTAQDQWTVTFADTFIFGGDTLFWEENPISPVLGNIVNESGTNQLFVFSDVITGRDPAGAPNGSILSGSASDSGNPVTVNFTSMTTGMAQVVFPILGLL
jgi:hypothetical protein